MRKAGENYLLTTTPAEKWLKLFGREVVGFDYLLRMPSSIFSSNQIFCVNFCILNMYFDCKDLYTLVWSDMWSRPLAVKTARDQQAVDRVRSNFCTLTFQHNSNFCCIYQLKYQN